MLAEVLIGLDPATKKSGQQKSRKLNAQKEMIEAPVMTEEILKAGQHGFEYAHNPACRDLIGSVGLAS